VTALAQLARAREPLLDGGDLSGIIHKPQPKRRHPQMRERDATAQVWWAEV
jgi:hypothetical protein